MLIHHASMSILQHQAIYNSMKYIKFQQLGNKMCNVSDFSQQHVLNNRRRDGRIFMKYTSGGARAREAAAEFHT